MANKLYKLFVKIEPDEDETIRDVNFFNFIATFFRETTLGGFPQLIKQPGIIKKLFWLASIGLMAYGLVWECQVFFDKFLSWSPTTTVTIATSKSLYFPAITLCNNNPVTADWYDQAMGTGGASNSNTGTGTTGGSGTGGGSDSTAAGGGGSGGSSGTTLPVAGSDGTTLAAAVTGGTGGTAGAGTGGTTDTASTGAGTAPSSGGPGRRRREVTDVWNDVAITEATPSAVERQKRQAAATGGSQQNQQQNQQYNAVSLSNAPPVQMPTFSGKMQSTMAVQQKSSWMTYSTRSSAGHALCDMVLECQFAGVTCNPGTSFKTWHWNSQFGNCFTFNPGYLKSESPATGTLDPWTIKIGGSSNNSGVRVSTLPGDSYGLYLLLNADTDHYISSTTQVGWRLTIHNQTEMPFPEESGIFIAPGTSSRVGLSLSYIEKLGVIWNGIYNASYSDCVDQGDLSGDDFNNAYSKLLEVGYTQSACYKTCYQRAVMSTCGCFDFLFPNQGKAFSSSGSNSIPPCSYDNSTMWTCKLSVAALYRADNLSCGDNCKETCKSYSMSTVLSSLKWPNPTASSIQTVCNEILDILKKRINGTDSTCTGRSNIKNMASSEQSIKVMDDLIACASGQLRSPISSYYEAAEFIIGYQFAEVYIYYKDFNYQTVIDSEPTEISDLLAYLGGIVGLFFGFSFMTLMEYVQLLLDLILIAIGKLSLLCCKNKTADQPKSGQETQQRQQNYAKPQSSKKEQVVSGGASFTTDNMYDSMIAKPASAYFPSNYGQLVQRQQTPRINVDQQHVQPERQSTANANAAANAYYSYLSSTNPYPYPPPPE